MKLKRPSIIFLAIALAHNAVAAAILAPPRDGLSRRADDKKEGDEGKDITDKSQDEILVDIQTRLGNAIQEFLAVKGTSPGAGKTFIAQPTWPGTFIDTKGVEVTPEEEEEMEDELTGEGEGEEAGGEGAEEEPKEDEEKPKERRGSRVRLKRLKYHKRQDGEDTDVLRLRDEGEATEDEETEGDGEDEELDDVKVKEDSEAEIAMNKFSHMFDYAPLAVDDEKDDEKDEKKDDKKDSRIRLVSESYASFVTKVGAIFSPSGTSEKEKKQRKQLDKAVKLEGFYCYKNLNKVRDEALDMYRDSKGRPAKSIEDIDDPPSIYKEAQNKCQAAKNYYMKKSKEVYGDNFARISNALNNVAPLRSVSKDVVPGLSMRLAKGGNPVAYYEVEGVKNSVASWKQSSGPDGTQSARFKTSLETASGENTEKTHSESSSIGLQWTKFGVGGGHSKESSEKSMKAKSTKMEVSWYGALLKIRPGIWQDEFALATIVADIRDNMNKKEKRAKKDDDDEDEGDKEEKDDEDDSEEEEDDSEEKDNSKEDDEKAAATEAEKNKKAVALLEQYMGTEEKPGPAAEFNDYALLIYRPHFTIKFESSEVVETMEKSQASGNTCFFFICVTGSSSDSKASMSYDKAKMEISYKDQSDMVYYAGSMKNNFWEMRKAK